MDEFSIPLREYISQQFESHQALMDEKFKNVETKLDHLSTHGKDHETRIRKLERIRKWDRMAAVVISALAGFLTGGGI